MTFEEFEPTIGRLRAVYGEKAFPRERVDVIFRALHYVPIQVWAETLTELIGESMHAPPLSKIREVMYIVRKRMGHAEDMWEPVRRQIAELGMNPNPCDRCFNSGIFMAHKRTDEHAFMYCFVCDCRAGELAKKLPENKGKAREWSMPLAHDWRHDFEGELMGGTASRNAARAAVSDAFRAGDLNVAVGQPMPPRRGYEADKWEADL